MKTMYICLRNIVIMSLLCMLLSACAVEEEEGANVPACLLGTWGLTTKEKAKENIVILEIHPVRIVMIGVYLDIQRVDAIDYTKERNFKNNTRAYPYMNTGSLYTKGPGAPGLFSQYRLSHDGETLYLDGGEILYGALSSSLSKIK